MQRLRYSGIYRLLFLVVLGLLLSSGSLAIAQQQTSPTDGMAENTPQVFAFTDATLVLSAGSVVRNGTLVIRDGIIEAAGRNVNIPADARVFNLSGKTIYPAFIDAYTHAGQLNPRTEIETGNLSWNPQQRSFIRAEQEFHSEDKAFEMLRSAGFAAGMSVPNTGIIRGKTAAFSLNEGSATDRLIRAGVAQSVTLSRDNSFGFTYPTSPIGVIALIRQSLYDARWHREAHRVWQQNPSGLQRPETNAALSSLELAATGSMPLVFESGSDEETLRALRISREFGLKPWILGSGHEYRISDYLKNQEFSLILPLNFPEAPNVKTPEDALNQSLANLRHWYLAPENPARIAREGISFSLTAHGHESASSFLANLKLAVQAGLDRNVALDALTKNPAALLGISRTHGTLERGKNASFIITDGDIFDADTRVMETWADGKRYIINPNPEHSPRGVWELSSSDAFLYGKLEIKESRPGRFEAIWHRNNDDDKITLKNSSWHYESRRFRADIIDASMHDGRPVRLTATLAGNRLMGWTELSGDGRNEWSATRSEVTSAAERSTRELVARTLELSNTRPSMEFGRSGIPEQPRAILVQNATIWTMGSDGIIENADMLIRDGKIAEIGNGLRAPRNAVVIDAGGRHVTPGLIDAHLHSGVDGVNEIGNAITAEVRLGDVLNINNIWMYRQLAGGLTTAHVMHGSANPIGGQNALLKMRWGALSHELLIEDAPRTIKFALGENPKRVGSGRYPDTRMGVEQIIADRFRMAQDYMRAHEEFERTGRGIPPRRDLRLDALADILRGDIDVHSHSYRQDEILMLMRLADEIGFDIKAFHHGVEAFKVAPELAERGIGAVVWTDWGGFKIEAYDNTNFNARLLHEAGVMTSLHSDNSQIATRMNWEAAKMVRVGMDPETALSLVTIRTAKLLGIDDRVGSLEPGKDADFVLWSGDPLSTFTIAEQTWVDGRKYFDREEDIMLHESIEKERAALIQLIMEVSND